MYLPCNENRPQPGTSGAQTSWENMMKSASFKKSLWYTTVIPLSLTLGAVGVVGTVSDQLSFVPAAMAACGAKPCAAKANPCAAKANPCAAKAAANPCAAKNPCAAAKKK